MLLEVDRYRGAFMGLAVGDALGTTVEFSRPGTFTPVTDIVGGGPFGLPAGAWTDDTSMALCLAESLVEKRAFDPIDQLQRYVRWYRDGYLSSTGRCFDIGNSTSKALRRFENTGEPFPGDADPSGGGNGPLMKLAPVPMAFALRPTEAVARAADSARTTHGAPQAVDSARFFSLLLVRALQGASTTQILETEHSSSADALWGPEPLHPEVLQVAEGSYRDKQPPEIVGGGYSVRALEAALWALHTTDAFEDGVLAAVNLGDDADTTGAIYGQLAGAIYGIDAIPEHWRQRIVMADRILELAEGLHAFAVEMGQDDG